MKCKIHSAVGWREMIKCAVLITLLIVLLLKCGGPSQAQSQGAVNSQLEINCLASQILCEPRIHLSIAHLFLQMFPALDSTLWSEIVCTCLVKLFSSRACKILHSIQTQAHLSCVWREMSTLGAVGPVMVAMLESGIFPTGLLFPEEVTFLIPASPEVDSLTKFA